MKDLFEHYEEIPTRVQEVFEKYQEKFGDDFGKMDYQDMKQMNDEVLAFGFSFDSYLQNEPFNLQYIGEKFARKCDATGKGMNEGWVCGEGNKYFSTEEGLINHLRSLDWEDCNGVKSKDISDPDELREYFYNEDYFYYTEWDVESEMEEDGCFYTAEGDEISV